MYERSFVPCYPEAGCGRRICRAAQRLECRQQGSSPKFTNHGERATLAAIMYETSREILRPKEGLRMTGQSFALLIHALHQSDPPLALTLLRVLRASVVNSAVRAPW